MLGFFKQNRLHARCRARACHAYGGMGMATIKDVAALAGVSLSTVSIVANGRAKQRNISQATQERVLDAMREVGYRPSVAARKLRGGKERRQLTVFWADDFREIMLARFLKGLHAKLEQCGVELDVGVETYRNGELSRVGALCGAPTFDAAIIANASPDDLAFLAEMKPLAPMVLYNRELEGYASVVVDDAEVGAMAAQRAVAWLGGRDNGERLPVVCLRAPAAFEGMLIREEAFCAGLRDAVSCLFAPSDAVAMGVLHRCWELGIRVPNDMGVISVGNGAVEYAEHACPPLTCVSIPMEEMQGTASCFWGTRLALCPPRTARACAAYPRACASAHPCSAAAIGALIVREVDAVLFCKRNHCGVA